MRPLHFSPHTEFCHPTHGTSEYGAMTFQVTASYLSLSHYLAKASSKSYGILIRGGSCERWGWRGSYPCVSKPPLHISSRLITQLRLPMSLISRRVPATIDGVGVDEYPQFGPRNTSQKTSTVAELAQTVPMRRSTCVINTNGYSGH